MLNDCPLVGWLSSSRQVRDANTGFQQSYDQTTYGSASSEVGMKDRLVDLISAVRTLMRSAYLLPYRAVSKLTTSCVVPLIAINTLVILYELVWG